MMRASFNVKLVYCSPCCLVRVLCALLMRKQVIIIHADDKTVVRMGFEWHLRGSRWSETDPVIIYQCSRL